MGTHATPELTSPVSRGQSASTGITQNIGTAQGSNSGIQGLGGFVNNSMGGSADRGVQSFANAAKSPSAVVADPLHGGGSFSVSTSSVNPLSIQNDSSADVLSKTVVQTDAATTSTPGQGYHTNQPKSNAVELPANTVKVHVPYSATIAAPTAISYKGIETSLVTGSVDDNVINKLAVPTALANQTPDHHEDGAAFKGPQGLPTSSVQDRSAANIQPGPNPIMPFQNGTADKP